jgi:hypothetical protein
MSSISSPIAAGSSSCLTYTVAVYAVLSSWWWTERPKHVERFTRINNEITVVCCWLYYRNITERYQPPDIKNVPINLYGVGLHVWASPGDVGHNINNYFMILESRRNRLCVSSASKDTAVNHTKCSDEKLSLHHFVHHKPHTKAQNRLTSERLDNVTKFKDGLCRGTTISKPKCIYGVKNRIKFGECLVPFTS